MGFFPYSTQNHQLKILSIASLERIAKYLTHHNSTYMAYSYQFVTRRSTPILALITKMDVLWHK